jgi:hypothetical protein
MPFAADDVYVGMIAYFRINDLMRHGRIRHTETSHDNKVRPFICYAQADGQTYWTYFTGTPKPYRKTVARKWLRHPPGRTALASAGDLIVSDARSTFVGPADAFAKCSRRFDDWNGPYRPMLLLEGVVQVQMLVSGRGGLLPGIERAPCQMQAEAA